MAGRLRAFGLTLIAVMALGVVMAPAAFAEVEMHSEPEGEAEAKETTITGVPDGTGETAHHVLEFPTAQVSMTCKKTSLDGTMQGGAVAELSMTFKYEECTFNGENVVVDSGDCLFKVKFKGELEVVSKAGGNCNLNPIRIKGKCEVRMGTQASVGKLTFTNLKTEVTMETSISGLTYTAEGAACPKAGTFKDGKYVKGNEILKGEDPMTLKAIPIQVK